MANEIKLKRGSGSDPSASDLVVGEIAIRTDTGKLFTKKDDNSVAEISGGIDDGDKGDITVSNSGGTFTIDNGVVTSAKIANDTIVNADINSSAAIALSKLATGTLPSGLKIDTDNILTGAVTTGKIATGTIINGDISTSAAIAGSKISPDFGSQDITTTGNLDLPDDAKLKLGTGDDLHLFHDGTQSIIENYTGHLIIRGNRDDDDGGNIYIQAKVNENSILCNDDGSVELYHDNSKKFETSSSGGTLTGNLAVTGTVDGRDLATDGTKLDGIESGATADQSASEIVALIADQTIAPSTIDMEDNEKIKLGTGDDLELYHDGSISRIQADTSHLYLKGVDITLFKGNSSEKFIHCESDAQVELYHNNSKKAETVSGGFTVTGTCTATDFSGDGSSLTSLNASNIGSGTLNTARLPTTITHAGQVILQSTGSGNDVKLDAADFIILEAGEEEDGGILFRGNSGVDSYRFAKGGQHTIEGFLSFESLSADRTFTFPDTTGTLALTSSDITGNAATATALATARTIGGTSFDGTANITPAECTNADTVDSLHASSFLRSDAADTMSQSTSGTATLTVTNSGGAGSGIGTGAIVAEFNGDSDGVVIRNIGGGDYSIMNDQQNNGFVLYDGTGGVDIVYNGVVRVEFDNGNTYGDFKGTPSVNGTNLALITDVGGGATGGGSDEVFYENDQNVTTDYTITNGKNAMAAGPITIDSGATVTVGSGETLTIV